MGLATARLFAAEGAHVAVTDLSAECAKRVADEIVQSGGSAVGFELDVSRGDLIPQRVEETVAVIGGLDILVNNAGVAWIGEIDDPSYFENWSRVLSVVLEGQARLIRAALAHLRCSSHGRIVNIASTEALGATAGFSIYAAAKAGVTGLTRALAVEFGRSGITVNCVCPGPIDTEMTRGVSSEDKAMFAKRRTALGRYGLPEEVAHITLSLSLPAASYVTGATIPVDGGLMARNA
jgi:3-oxoacyl-[acyl-carrier protein] reductase